jgi:hypothetical protein
MPTILDTALQHILVVARSRLIRRDLDLARFIASQHRAYVSSVFSAARDGEMQPFFVGPNQYFTYRHVRNDGRTP